MRRWNGTSSVIWSPGNMLWVWCNIDWTSFNVRRTSLRKKRFSSLRWFLACSACSKATSRKPWPLPKTSVPSTTATFAQRMPLWAVDTLLWVSATFCHFSKTRSTSFSFFFNSAWCVDRNPWRSVRVRWSSAVVCLWAFSDDWSDLREALQKY